MILLNRIERYLRTTNMTAARFGREALRDPRFVFDLRNGRAVSAATERRVATWLDAREREAA